MHFFFIQPLSGQGGALGKKFVYGAIKDKKKKSSEIFWPLDFLNMDAG